MCLALSAVTGLGRVAWPTSWESWRRLKKAGKGWLVVCRVVSYLVVLDGIWVDASKAAGSA